MDYELIPQFRTATCRTLKHFVVMTCTLSSSPSPRKSLCRDLSGRVAVHLVVDHLLCRK